MQVAVNALSHQTEDRDLQDKGDGCLCALVLGLQDKGDGCFVPAY